MTTNWLSQVATRERGSIYVPAGIVRLVVGLALVVGVFATASTAQAFDDGIFPGEFSVERFEASAFRSSDPGNSVAGEVVPHPNGGSHEDFKLTARFHVNNGQWLNWSNEDTAKTTEISLPAYLLGNPNVAAKCASIEFLEDRCVGDAYIGFVNAQTRARLPLVTGGSWWNIGIEGGVYNLQPEGNDLATFGIHLAWAAYDLHPVAHVRVDPNDRHRIITTIDEVPNSGYGGAFLMDQIDMVLYGMHGNKPFLTYPTNCDSSATVDLYAEAYNGRTSGGQVPLYKDGNCRVVDPAGGFTPRIAEASPDTSRVDTPTPYNMTVQLPREEGDDGYLGGSAAAQSAVKDMSIDMQPGLRLSPGVVGKDGSGLTECSVVAFQVWNQADPARCPESSQIAEATIKSAELGEVPGKVFFGFPYTASGKDGRPAGIGMKVWLQVNTYNHWGDDAQLTKFRLKAQGDIIVDNRGRIHASFKNLEPLPWRSLQMRFVTASGKGVLVTPPECNTGNDVTSVTLTPSSGAASVTRTHHLAATWDGRSAACPNPRPFKPTVSSASLSSTKTAVPATMSLQMARNAYDDAIKGLNIKLPTGMYANLPANLCTDADVTGGTCKQRIGEVRADIGFGDDTTQIRGDAFLATPVGTNIARIIVALRAKVGPIDLGTVYVPMDVHLDSTIPFKISIRANQLPTTVQGIDAPIQQMVFAIDQPGFLTTPTMCGNWDFQADFTSVRGSAGSSTFTVPGCAGAKSDDSPKTAAQAALPGWKPATQSAQAAAAAKPIAKTAITKPKTVRAKNNRKLQKLRALARKKKQQAEKRRKHMR